MEKVQIKKKIIFLVLLILAAALRFYKLDQVPVELFGDELDIGCQAYSLIKTGGDYFGNRRPIFFRSFDEYRMGVLVYLTAPWVGFFGLNAWAVRLTPALFGCLSIFLFWYLLKQTTNDGLMALMGAVLMSFAPWHFHYSRSGFDVTVLLVIVLSALIFFLRGLKNNFWLVISFLFWPLAFYTYSPSLVFSLFFLPFLFWLFQKKVKHLSKRNLLTAGVGFLLILIPLFVNLINQKASQRFSKINLVNDPRMIDELYQKRAQSNGGGRIFHNKGLYLGKKFVSNYLQAFSPEFLFISGDPSPRHSVSNFGLLPFVFAPLLLLGFYRMASGKEMSFKKADLLFLGWLLTAPIASALTIEGGNHATRLFLMLPPLLYFSALGGKVILDFKNKLIGKGLFLLLTFVFVGEGVLYFHEYFFHYPREAWEHFDYGYQEAFDYLKESNFDYDQIFIDSAEGLPILPVLYWLAIDPGYVKDNYQGQAWKSDIYPDFDGFRIGKYYFGQLQKPAELAEFLSSKMVYLAFQNSSVVPGDWDWRWSAPEGVQVLKVVEKPFASDPLIYLLTKEND